MRIMGLDYGSRTVGVAISDALGITAQGIETITRKEENKLRKTCARIEELIKVEIPPAVYNMLPYIVSLIVLAFTSKNSRAPKAEGIPYDKGQR